MGERKHEIKIRKKKIKERNKKLKILGFRNVQMLHLNKTFKEKLKKELLEVENIDKWQIVEQETISATEVTGMEATK